MSETTHDGFTPDPAKYLLIVVGSTLRCELTDRPLGYRLRESILRWQDDALEDEIDEAARRTPVVVTDVIYLNDSGLMSMPAICIGAPTSNAASAYHASRLPTAFVMEDVMRVQLDPEFIDAKAALWGVDGSSTISAVDLFAERYLPDFLAHLHHLPTDAA